MEQNRPQGPAGLPPSMRSTAPRPAHKPQHHDPRPPAPHVPPQPPKKSKGVLIAGLVALVLIAITITGAGIMQLASNLSTATAVKSNGYQAVFLTNNMVYFGKISDINDKYIKMTDIFYLQVQQPNTDAKTQQQSQLSLTKLGNELHGPEDAMYINAKEVLFWENLKADGKVTAAIKDYKSKNDGK